MMPIFAIAVSSGGTAAPAVEFQVHRQGCIDIARGIRLRKYSHAYAVSADTPQEAVQDEAAEYTHNEQGYAEADFQIMPCATLTAGLTSGKIDPASTTNPPDPEDGQEGTSTMATTTTQACGCGCGEPVTRRFKPGHDARLKGTMLRLFRSGEKAKVATAKDVAAENGWEHLLTDQPSTKAPRKAKSNGQGERTGFNPVRVKVGRWTYDAILISEDADSVTVEYKGAGGGQPTRKTVKRSALVE